MYYKPLKIKLLSKHGIKESLEAMRLPLDKKGSTNDDALSRKLIKAGSSHAKFSRGIVYWVYTEFQAGFMIELDTYRIGREVLSTSSSMHNELRHLTSIKLADKKQKDLSNKVYRQIATYSAQCLRKIYMERRKHRHPDWKIFCDWIEQLEEFMRFIIP